MGSQQSMIYLGAGMNALFAACSRLVTCASYEFAAQAINTLVRAAVKASLKDLGDG